MNFNIADLYESLADVIGHREALVCGDTRMTYAQLEARANRLAHWFAAQGIGSGDHVGLYLYNGAEFVEAMLALFKVRAVPININYRYVTEELRYLFDNADLKGVVFQRSVTPLVAEVAPECPLLKTFLAVEDGDCSDPGSLGADLEALGATSYEDAMKSGSEERDFGERSGDDQYIVYTGGTTGMPRGVMWRQEDVFFAGLQGGRPGGDSIETPEELAVVAASGDVALNVLPTAAFIHGAAQWAAWICLFTGGKLVVVPGRSYDPDKCWELIDTEDIDTVLLVGDAMARPLADSLAKRRDSDVVADRVVAENLMVIASSGAILSDAVKEQLQGLLPMTMVLNNFGATETGHQGSCYPGMEKEGKTTFFMDESNMVFDEETCQPLEPGSGKMGVLGRKGRLPLGYYKDPDKTARTFIDIDGERWAVLGDYATLEDDGMVTVYGRGSVCINSGGEKVFVEEVEQAMKAHPAVFDAVVVGVPDERWGSRVAAVVELRPGHTADFATLDRHTRDYVAGYKAPREMHFVDTVKRHPSGKPDYRWAKATAIEMAESAAAAAHGAAA